MMPGVYSAVFERLSGRTFTAFVFQPFEHFEAEFAFRIAEGIPESFICL